LKLTTKSEYSLLALIYIARRQDEGYVKIEDICSEYGISKKYLFQIFASLKRARYVSAKTGCRGGYRLSRPAGKICVAEIIRYMDGALAPAVAVSKYFFEHTPLEKEPKIMRVFKDIRDYVCGSMESLKISDLV